VCIEKEVFFRGMFVKEKKREGGVIVVEWLEVCVCVCVWCVCVLVDRERV